MILADAPLWEQWTFYVYMTPIVLSPLLFEVDQKLYHASDRKVAIIVFPFFAFCFFAMLIMLWDMAYRDLT